MRTVIGVFKSLDNAERAVADLKKIIAPAEYAKLFYPERDHLKYDSVKVTDTVDRRGFGIAIGSISLGLATAAVNVMIFGTPLQPGNWSGFVAPLVVSLVVAAALLGAWLGTIVFDPYRHAAIQGVSAEDFYFYHDALQHGNYLVMATTMTAQRAEHMQKLLAQLGTFNHQQVREQWWQSLRESEAEYYQDNENAYRVGFEAALNPELSTHSYDQAIAMLRAKFGGIADQDFFRRGYERGHLYVNRQHFHTRRAA